MRPIPGPGRGDGQIARSIVASSRVESRSSHPNVLVHQLGRLAGIPLFVHWTFLILLAFIGFRAYAVSGEDLGAAMRAVLMVLAVFGCVVLHELGHALMARRFGVPTADITLLPIGGVARLQRIPEKPSQELFVALAGPAVNVVIAVVLIGGLVLSGPAWPT